MKNVLIIIAHPRKDSLCVTMANTYEKASKESGNNIEVINLYHTKHQLPFFIHDDHHHTKQNKEMDFYQSEIKKADEIVFFFPYWWGSMPAILKNFFEWNLTKGFAFTYKNHCPLGLLKNKQVKLFTTTGAPKIFYFITGTNSRFKSMFKHIVGFCGMKLVSCNIYGGLDTRFKNVDKILKDIPKRI